MDQYPHTIVWGMNIHHLAAFFWFHQGVPFGFDSPGLSGFLKESKAAAVLSQQRPAPLWCGVAWKVCSWLSFI
jgi:hypothetical protein